MRRSRARGLCESLVRFKVKTTHIILDRLVTALIQFTLFAFALRSLEALIDEANFASSFARRALNMLDFSVGTLVLIDGVRSAELACSNDDGSWDCILDDGSDEDAVPPSRLVLAETQRTRPPIVEGTCLEAAAASLRLSLTKDPDGEDNKASAPRHMSRVWDGGDSSAGGAVWLGDKKAAQSLELLRARGVSAVLNATCNIPNSFEIPESPPIAYHNLRCQDAEAEASALDAQLDAALDQLAVWVGEGRQVLVHCHAGRSRSATVVIAFLMRERRMQLGAATELVFASRAVLPNAGFYAVLHKREARWLRGSQPAGAAASSPPISTLTGPPAPPHAELARRFVQALTQQADYALERSAEESNLYGRKR